MKEKLEQATMDILLKNMKIETFPYSVEKVVIVYDDESRLAKDIGESYRKNLEKRDNSLVYNISEIEKEELIKILTELPKNSTVILVQSTNFRLDDFRIRMTLHKQGVGCLEHNHLSYLHDNEYETYIDSLMYRGDEFTKLSNTFKKLSDNAETAKIVCQDGSTLEISGGFEDMKQNIGDYSLGNRGSTLPLGENFTESKIFENVNGQLSINCYPDKNFNIHFCEPFIVKIQNSLITCDDEKCPAIFREFLDKISKSEDGVVMLRELGFGLNPAISNKTPLNDVNAFERKLGFHFSMGKKHGIYRKKIHRKTIQRYHIDVFPDIKEIYFDDILVLQDGEYKI